MELWYWIRFVVGTLFLLAGMFIFILEVAGVFHLHYVLNRMHMASTGDTLGIGLALFGLMVLSGANFTTLKLAFIIVLLWFASPVSSHLIARMEVETNEGDAHYERIDLTEKQKNGEE